MRKSAEPFERMPIIALGTMTFGAQTSASDADRMLRMFLDEGHSWVDTAFMYAEGRSETILGRLLKGRTREKVFLATKAYPDKLGKGKPRGLMPGSVRGQLETSLRRLRTDYVDLFYLHAPDNRTPLEVTLAACHELAGEGKTRQLGLSNYASWQAAEAALHLRAERLAAAGRLPGHVQRRHARRRARVHPGVPAFRAAVHRVQPARRRPADRQARRPQRDTGRRPILRRVLPRAILEGGVFCGGRRAAAGGAQEPHPAGGGVAAMAASPFAVRRPSRSARARWSICARTSRPAAKARCRRRSSAPSTRSGSGRGPCASGTSETDRHSKSRNRNLTRLPAGGV